MRWSCHQATEVSRDSLELALGRSPSERVGVVRTLVEKVVVDEKALIIRLRRGPLLSYRGILVTIGGQAASGCWLTASMPSTNFIPLTSFGN